MLILGLDNSTARWFYDKDSISERRIIINTWFWFYLSISFIFTLLIFFLSSGISQLLFHNPDNSLYLKIMALVLPMNAMMNVTTNVLRFDRRPVPTVTVTLMQSLSLIGINILFVVHYRMGLRGIYYAQLISTGLACCMAFFYIRRWLTKPAIDFRLLKDMLKYSLPFLPAAIAFWVVNLSGTFFINHFKGNAESGLFQIGVSIASGGALFITAFQQAWMPFAFSIHKQENAKKTYAQVFLLYISAMACLCVGMAFFSKELLWILTNKSYYKAASISAILTFSYFFMGLTYIADLGTAITKQTKPLGFILIISAILYPVLSLVLVPWLGKEGAAIATCLSQAIVPLYMFYKSQKAYFIPYNFREGWLIFTSSIVLSLLAWYMPGISENLIIKIVIFILYVASIIQFLAKVNNIRLKEFVAQKLGRSKIS